MFNNQHTHTQPKCKWDVELHQSCGTGWELGFEQTGCYFFHPSWKVWLYGGGWACQHTVEFRCRWSLDLGGFVGWVPVGPCCPACASTFWMVSSKLSGRNARCLKQPGRRHSTETVWFEAMLTIWPPTIHNLGAFQSWTPIASHCHP